MSEVEDGNYITEDHMNQFRQIFERNTCFKHVSLSFIQYPELINPVSTPLIRILSFEQQFSDVVLATIIS